LCGAYLGAPWLTPYGRRRGHAWATKQLPQQGLPDSSCGVFPTPPFVLKTAGTQAAYCSVNAPPPE